MYSEFVRKPSYLTSYHLKSLLIVSFLDAALVYYMPFTAWKMALYGPALLLLSSTSFYSVLLGYAACLILTAKFETLGFTTALLFPAAILCGLIATSLLHNASHDNIRPRWLGRPLGELLGLFQLVGFPDWVIIHIMHHSHADDPKKDPHPPMDLGYWKFMTEMRSSILRVFAAEYFALFGENEKSLRELKRFGRVSRLEQLAKVCFFLLLLGPRVFTCFFVTSVVFKMMHYAWFNWSTHKPAKSGAGYDVLNHNEHVYKLVNFLTSGFYFHRNHHLNPKLFDPRRLSFDKPKQHELPFDDPDQLRKAA